MASPTTQMKKIRKRKARTCGAARKAAIRQEHRSISEAVLENALCEKISLLKTV